MVEYQFPEFYLYSDVWTIAKCFGLSNNHKTPIVRITRPRYFPSRRRIEDFEMIESVYLPVRGRIECMTLIFLPNEGWFGKHDLNPRTKLQQPTSTDAEV